MSLLYLTSGGVLLNADDCLPITTCLTYTQVDLFGSSLFSPQLNSAPGNLLSAGRESELREQEEKVQRGEEKTVMCDV